MKSKIILYHTSWCAPCNELIKNGWRQFKNIVINSNLFDILDVHEINCEFYQDDIEIKNIQKYPTMRLYIDNYVYELCGNKTEYEILNFVNQYLV